MLKKKVAAVGVQSVILFEDGRRNCARWRGRECMLPAFYARDLGKMLARVLLRQDASSGFVQPFVTSGMIEVPVSIYQLFDGVRINARQRCGNMRTRSDNFSINEELSVGAGKDGDISACAQKNADIAAKRLNCNFCRCRGL